MIFYTIFICQRYPSQAMSFGLTNGCRTGVGAAPYGGSDWVWSAHVRDMAVKRNDPEVRSRCRAEFDLSFSKKGIFRAVHDFLFLTRFLILFSLFPSHTSIICNFIPLLILPLFQSLIFFISNICSLDFDLQFVVISWTSVYSIFVQQLIRTLDLYWNETCSILSVSLV